MTIEELYDKIGGNYEGALNRLRSDMLVSRFIVKFLDDKSCENLFAAWAEGDEQAAFEAAHAAKGVCANLAIDGLAETASAITEALRPGNDAVRASTDVDALVNELKANYAVATEAIAAFASEQ